MFTAYLAAEPRVATHGSRMKALSMIGVILYQVELALDGEHVSAVGTLALREGKI